MRFYFHSRSNLAGSRPTGIIRLPLRDSQHNAKLAGGRASAGGAITAKLNRDVVSGGEACIAAVRKLSRSGVLGKADRVRIYTTGGGYKYLEACLDHA